MSFLTGAALTMAIRRVTAARSVSMAVAFWGGDALDLLALPSDLSGYRIACDAFSGACNPKAMVELFKRQAKVRDVPGLHAKVYLSGDAMVVTSANASTNGLTEDGSDLGLEAGISVSTQDQLDRAAAWFDDIFGRGRSLGPKDLPEMRRLWKARRATRPLRMTLAHAILTNDASLADRSIRAYVYDADAPSKSVQKRFKDSPYFNPTLWDEDSYPFFWGDLPGAPPGSELLCFEAENGKTSFDNLWRILAEVKDKEPAIWPALKLADAAGMPIGDMKVVAKRIAGALAQGRIESGGEPISLTDLAAALAEPMADDHIALISAEPARVAYRLLAGATASLGLWSSYKTGKVPAVRLEDARGRYILSFIPNRAHLLFYIRHPALKARPGLARSATDFGLPVIFNPSGEPTIRIHTGGEARRVLDWLESVLPLP
ncbi:phospholipase D family protein [Sphingobium sp. LF-16]|uniref:phospholipase D family protein n=1 Tax=Sphingobium sp. LF-16 TaxID=2185111 RepID=UPI000F0781AF|nr:phospholipase D family protein [Sphingobium sp. LF-16]